ncbi:enoyl-CoA hydratase-related protein [Leptospira sp. 2 VSF19]|uniref:Enoyl-CoA hydratase-related protein n=1 Tax=Leptospira soteropolitanensis TaxID=2950025 RepID=A0AAW5VAQ2_9LEPT|nr:enoyl-CoA hydratase-related protein [Leptospira soteropolitanensis]MCW7491327.1 enoyl-CoA hydratase-related protein [Leptospira soteropolitanensis]MCW7498912.1 enoyl-CoA hydratase-related protein [Leptospira soteropolitanensis]MCW7521496.1 enoyl-CoA hydratase-related protein [Leptospira soteropolitanensis]MCW7525015.1 enoyl-CoA hydratase-related protein [Leptospira soteropolitanensis]MCW7528883.1 enoyl-CoA hydratase-related protein [Leptospira soteropolitanensis]
MNTVTLQTHHSYVALIELNRPEAKNAISIQLLSELQEKIKEINKSKVRAVVITGIGDSFCSGADLKERKSMSELQVKQFLKNINLCFSDLANLSIPTIAAINGFAFGGGLELALSCDIRYASESALMGLTETKLGIIPGAGGTQRLSRIVGESTALEWIFSGKKLSGKEAMSRGLVSQVLSPDSLKESSLALAREISESAPIAVSAAKKAVRRGLELPMESALEWERLCYFETIGTKDRMEALQAFAEKRKPDFKGE